MFIRSSVVADKKAPSFLFVVQAKKGEIKKNKAGQYELILKKADVNHVIMFSDRPYRIVKTITGKDVAVDWAEGTNSFKDDPPNAVLSGVGSKAETVILSSIHVKDQRIIFGFHGFTGHIGSLHTVTLTIDLSSDDFWYHGPPSAMPSPRPGYSVSCSTLTHRDAVATYSTATPCRPSVDSSWP